MQNTRLFGGLKMKQNVNDLKPVMIMLVVKNDNGTFSPLGMNEKQGYLLGRFIESLSKDNQLVKDNTELIISSDEKKRDNSNGDD